MINGELFPSMEDNKREGFGLVYFSFLVFVFFSKFCIKGIYVPSPPNHHRNQAEKLPVQSEIDRKFPA